MKLAKEKLSEQTSVGANELEGKKKLIDQTLGEMKSNLKNVEEIITKFSAERRQQFGEVSNQLKTAAEQTGKLQITTNTLNIALAIYPWALHSEGCLDYILPSAGNPVLAEVPGIGVS